MTIHSTHPFRDPEADPVRQLRGRLGGTVTLWTGGTDRRAGLTVSSVMVAAGEPGAVLALLDPDAELTETLLGSRRAVVQLLHWHHRDLAEAFAGVAPAPGGPFKLAEFDRTDWGPRVRDCATWAGLTLEDARPVGWSMLVTCAVEHVEIGADDVPLVHRRGRYQRPDGL